LKKSDPEQTTPPAVGEGASSSISRGRSIEGISWDDGAHVEYDEEDFEYGPKPFWPDDYGEYWEEEGEEEEAPEPSEGEEGPEKESPQRKQLNEDLKALTDAISKAGKMFPKKRTKSRTSLIFLPSPT
jgi:hypothetical protein